MSEAPPEGTAARFEDTLDVLEEQREETEARFRELLGELEERVAELRTATAEALEVHGTETAGRQAALDELHRQHGAATEATRSEPRAPWPGGRGLFRRCINRTARWLLRDYLEAMDRRADEVTARLDQVRLREAATATGWTSTAELLHRAARSATEALGAAAAVQREMLDLVNAKDAEVLQRAVAGPLRRMEIVFDEFGRQQEALLAELVGKRAELDALIERARPESG